MKTTSPKKVSSNHIPPLCLTGFPLEKAAAKNGKGSQEESDKEEHGINNLKAIKRKKGLDDLWAQMQEEDDYYKKKTKAQKTVENQAVPSIATMKPDAKIYE